MRAVCMRHPRLLRYLPAHLLPLTSCPHSPAPPSYEDDRDEGEWFLYTGSGGRDLSGNKRTNKEQSFDQVGGGVAGWEEGCQGGCLGDDVCAGGQRVAAAAGCRADVWGQSCCHSPSTPPTITPTLQTFDSMNKALKLSCTKGLPVRVVRSFKASARTPSAVPCVRAARAWRRSRCLLLAAQAGPQQQRDGRV